MILRTLVLLLLPLSVHAATAWKIMPAESKITFTATQNNSPVSGTFKNFSGDINFDPKDLATSHVHIVVDMGSVTTSYKEISDTLLLPEWFDAKVFPQAIFDATHFNKTGDKTYQADGTLSIRDKKIPVALTFTLDDFSAEKAHAKGFTQLKRSAFNVGNGEWAKTDEIKDDVKVEFVVGVSK